ncbi:hypothetical protein E1J61_30715 [Cupriavidus sp. L7L]|nr:hypothetical protein E1J61_30715 [Cupriavidus sp. L7L]
MADGAARARGWRAAAQGRRPGTDRQEGTRRNTTPVPPPVVCYRNAAGQSWDGQGDMPDWLRRAVNAGQSKAFYRAG